MRYIGMVFTVSCGCLSPLLSAPAFYIPHSAPIDGRLGVGGYKKQYKKIYVGDYTEKR